MPEIFISPSTQEFNRYAGGGNEEYYMNLIADELIPKLIQRGISIERNNPNDVVADVIVQSNLKPRDLHLAIHSNAGGGDFAGQLQGVEVYYSPESENGKRAAEIIAKNYKKIYPNKRSITIIPTIELGEVVQTKSPAVLVEVGFHDNFEEAQWIRENISAIADILEESVVQFLGDNS